MFKVMHHSKSCQPVFQVPVKLKWGRSCQHGVAKYHNYTEQDFSPGWMRTRWHTRILQVRRINVEKHDVPAPARICNRHFRNHNGNICTKWAFKIHIKKAVRAKFQTIIWINWHLKIVKYAFHTSGENLCFLWPVNQIWLNLDYLSPSPMTESESSWSVKKSAELNRVSRKLHPFETESDEVNITGWVRSDSILNKVILMGHYAILMPNYASMPSVFHCR